MTNYSSVRYASSGTTVYADMNALIAATGTDGAQAFVQSNNNIYVYSGSGWYKIATVQNDSPSAITGVDGTYRLADDGTPTVITAVSTDPEGFPLTWTYSTSGLGSTATVSQADNVFTITPSTTEADAGAFSLTINATDGVNGAVSANTSITLEFLIANSQYTTLLATAVDTSSNSNITDSSTNNHTITVIGDANAGTFSPYRHGGYSNYFDGNGDYLSIASNAAFGFGTGDFTIEFWTYWGGTLNSVNGGVFVELRSAVAAEALVVYLSTSGEIYFYDGPVNIEVGSGVTITQEWTHIALTRESGLWRIFVNGTLGTTRNSSTDLGSSKPCQIGQGVNGTTTSYNGYISDLRIVKGTALYTSNFTPPTERPTAITNTSLLTCHLPYITDGSSNAHAITVNGNTSTKPFGPYDYKEYSESTNGGSVFINAQGDQISTTTTAIGTSNFTLETWIYPTAQGAPNSIDGYQSIWASNYNSNPSFAFYQNGTSINIWTVDSGGSNNRSTSGTIIENAWNHVVWQRNGTGTNNNKVFLNGVETDSFTDSTNFSNTSMLLGSHNSTGSGVYEFHGYISDARFSRNTRYTSGNFIPPTTPLSSTGAELHIKGTDASIIDKSQGSNLNLVGNTIGSTTQVKFANTKSMYFDGSGDYIKTPTSTDYDLPTDFTIEAWIYPTALTSNRLIVDTYNASQAGSYQLYWRSTGGSLAFYTQADGVILQDPSGSNIQVNTWHHVAVARSGNTIRMFVDGTQVNSTTLTRDLTHGIPVAIGYQQATGTNYFAGYIQDVRITKGLARYTANFTPPTDSLKG